MGPARTIRASGCSHLYFDHAENRGMTHVGGTSDPIEPSRRHESRLLIPARDDSHWTGSDICGLGGSLMDLFDRFEDHRRGALDGPAHQVP